MSFCSVTIVSENLSGQTVDVTFYPASGGTIDLGSQVFPFTYVSDYYWGLYSCYSQTYDFTYTIEVPEFPTQTQTPSNTPTETPIPESPTPTTTPTPTQTPAVVYSEDLWRDGVFTNACDEAGFGPSNVIIYSIIPWGSLNIGDFVYGNSSLTNPPTMGLGNYISDGAIWIQFDIDSGEILDTGICP
jgi:hypothetical protein